MDFKHKNHLISSYLTLQEQLQENISDISPEVFERKFGALDPEERVHIAYKGGD
jgi:hypothetical protein